NSTGEIFRLESNAASSSIVTNASCSSCFMAILSSLEDFFLAPQISEGSDIRDNQRDAELIFRADRSEREAPVFQCDSAARSVVADLHELVLQDILIEVVTDSNRGVPTAAVQIAVADLRADLVCQRLQRCAVVDG